VPHASGAKFNSPERNELRNELLPLHVLFFITHPHSSIPVFHKNRSNAIIIRTFLDTYSGAKGKSVSLLCVVNRIRKNVRITVYRRVAVKAEKLLNKLVSLNTRVVIILFFIPHAIWFRFPVLGKTEPGRKKENQ
jgi:hypothetical protein